MWKYQEQVSFPLSEAEYMAQLDAVAELITQWGLVSTVRDGILRSSSRGPGYTGGGGARAVSVRKHRSWLAALRKRAPQILFTRVGLHWRRWRRSGERALRSKLAVLRRLHPEIRLTRAESNVADSQRQSPAGSVRYQHCLHTLLNPTDTVRGYQQPRSSPRG